MAPMVSKIAIIGGGVSGIAAAKQLSHHNPVIFEATDSIGGVWKHCAYHSTKLQSPRYGYQFSDFPWPNSENAGDCYPSHSEIVDYLTSYAKHFDVLKFVKFNSKVVELRYIGDQYPENGNVVHDDHEIPSSKHYGTLLPGRPVWEVAVKHNQSENIEWYAFELIVVCMGKYGNIPTIPAFPKNKGPEVFKGKVLHSMDYCKLDKESATDLLRGKKVAVIGYKKSAIDFAMECAEANQGPEGKACTMVVRTPHWTIPHYKIWGLPFYLFFSTRSAQFIHQRPNQTVLRMLLCLLMSPMKHAVTKFIESYLTRTFPLDKYGLKPNHPFVEDYASCQIPITPPLFFDQADKGLITFKRAQSWAFCDQGIEFDDGTKSQFDVVVLATGFDGKTKKLKSILPEPYRNLTENAAGFMPLYRGTINPMIPNMAFVGYIESVVNLHAAELRSIWLARLVDGKFSPPSIGKMLEQVNNEIEATRKTTRFYKRHCISTYSINHSDEICEEMGWNSWRKKSWFAEVFSPYAGQDYLNTGNC